MTFPPSIKQQMAERIAQGRQYVLDGTIPEGLGDVRGLVDRLTSTLEFASKRDIAEAINAETASAEPTKDDIRAMPCEACNAKPGQNCSQPHPQLRRIEVKWFHLSRIETARSAS